MPTPNFLLRLSGRDAEPSALALGELAELLESIEQLFENVALEAEPALDMGKMRVSLVDVRAGSIGLGFSSNLAPANEIQTLRIITDAITQRRYTQVPAAAIRPLRTLDDYVKRSRWTATWHIGHDQTPLAIIAPDVDLGLPQLEIISGETVEYGELTRVGGTPAKLRVRFLSGRALSCIASERVAKEAGMFLYDVIGMRGLAEWDANTMSLISFRVDALEPYRDTSIATAVQRLRDVARGGWDTVADVNTAIRELRGEPDE